MLFSLRTLLGGTVGAALIAASTLANSALLDFTDNTVLSALGTGKVSNSEYASSIDGIGFTVTSTGGDLNWREGYDGSTSTGCVSPGTEGLACKQDGIGIGNDEITGTSSGAQTITVTFDQEVKFTELYFLDLYLGKKTRSGQRAEQATATINGISYDLTASASSGTGGYGVLESPGFPAVISDSVVFSAVFGTCRNGIFDGRRHGDNDFAVAGISFDALNEVPLPAAAWLFLSGLAGLAYTRRRKATA